MGKLETGSQTDADRTPDGDGTDGSGDGAPGGTPTAPRLARWRRPFHRAVTHLRRHRSTTRGGPSTDTTASDHGTGSASGVTRTGDGTSGSVRTGHDPGGDGATAARDGDGADPAVQLGPGSRRRRVVAWVVRPGWRGWAPRLRIVVFALVGATLAVALAGRVSAEIGPFEATVAARPSRAGQTTVHLAPLGTIVLDTHDWPVALELSADEISLREAERIAQQPELIEDRLGDDLAEEVRNALWRLAVRCALLALAGGVVGALVARLHWRSAVAGVGAGAVLVVGIGAGTAATFDANAVSEPRYTGLLTAAPTAVGDLESIVDRFGEYRAQLSELVGNVSSLYVAANGLPTFEPQDHTIRLLHVSDVHLNPAAFNVMDQLTEQFKVDAIVDTGDLTDWGTTPETQFADNISRLSVPYVYVRGNHDSQAIQDAVADQPNAVVLDGEAADVAGLRIWGIGDPRYTPDKDQETGVDAEHEQADAFAPEVADQLLEDEPPEVDVVMVHDERMAAAVGGEVPLVLSGHTHKAREGRIPDEPPEPENGGDGTTTTTESPSAEVTAGSDETVSLVEGSTGGAGLRGLQGDEPKPLTATVLYFHPEDKRLVAYDRITVQGFGETGVTIERHVVVN